MVKRTTIEIDEELLERAKRSLGRGTARATIEEALRLAVEATERERTERRARQMEYLDSLAENIDLEVLASDEMWR